MTKQTSWTLPAKNEPQSLNGPNYIPPNQIIPSQQLQQQQPSQQQLLQHQTAPHLADLQMSEKKSSIAITSQSDLTSASTSTFSSTASSMSGSVSTSHDDLFQNYTLLPMSVSSTSTFTNGANNNNNNTNISNSGLVTTQPSSIPDLERMSEEQRMNALLSSMPMPSGWQRAFTSTGEVYFINHTSKTTCWEDPRIPHIPAFLRHLQQQQQQQQQHFQQTSATQLQMQFGQIEAIKNTLLESMEKKRELGRLLEDLNKKEAQLRAQLNQALAELTASMASSSSASSVVSSPPQQQPSSLDDVNLMASDDLNQLDLTTTSIEQPSTTKPNTAVNNNNNELDSVSNLYTKLQLIQSSQNQQNQNNVIGSSGGGGVVMAMRPNNTNNSNSSRTTLSSISLNSGGSGVTVADMMSVNKKQAQVFDSSSAMLIGSNESSLQQQQQSQLSFAPSPSLSLSTPTSTAPPQPSMFHMF